MSTQPTSFRYPKPATWEDGIRLAMNSLKDLNDAVVALKQQQGAATTTEVITQVVQQVVSGQLPVSIAALAHFYLTGYDSITGAFSSAQPSAADLSDTPTSGNVLRANGTSFISAVLAAADLSNGTTGTGAVVLAGSPALTGTPTAPTAAATDNSTEVATTAYVKSQVLPGTSGSLNPGAMTAGQRATINVTITGATTAMVATCSPVTDPGAGFVWHAYVSAADTVTVCLTCVANGTPTASTYDVRVLI